MHGTVSSREVRILFAPWRGSGRPVFLQLVRHVRTQLEQGCIREGDRLPSIRRLAAELGVSPDTVERAYRELCEEGYLTARRGSGFCAALPPEARVPCGIAGRSPAACAERALTPCARAAAEACRSFRPGSVKERPLATYASEMGDCVEKEFTRLAAHFARSPWSHNYYSSPFGLKALRDLVRDHLRRTQGIACESEQIIITSGTVQSLSLAAQVLFEAGDEILLEGPSLGVFADVFAFQGLRRTFVPVDGRGFGLESVPERSLSARGALVTPASQMALSVTMPLERRKALLDWARCTGAWIIEEDTDNLVRLDGTALPPIRSLPGAEDCTLYLDSFTLMFFPGIKLAYMVVPKGYEEAFAGAKLLSDRSCPESTQELLSQFIVSDFFESYRRRLLRRYRSRFAFTAALCRRELAPFGSLAETKAGPHLTFLLKPGFSDAEVADAAERRGVIVRPLSGFRGVPPGVSGFNIGYGTFSEEQIREAVGTLRNILESLAPRR